MASHDQHYRRWRTSSTTSPQVCTNRRSGASLAVAAVAAALLCAMSPAAADDVLVPHGTINIHDIRPAFNYTGDTTTTTTSPGAASSDGPTPQGGHLRRELQANGITPHGGPVMLGTTNIYYIWYGNWAGNNGVQILTDFANNFGELSRSCVMALIFKNCEDWGNGGR